MPARRVRVLTGLYRDAYGFEARVCWRGQVRTRRYPFGTDKATMQGWRSDERAAMADDDPQGLPRSFREDARRYLNLPRVRKLASFKDREDDVTRWVTLFGDIDRRLIKAKHANPHLEKWAETYAPATVNHRGDALRAIWRELDKTTRPLDGLFRLPSRSAVRLAPPRERIHRVLASLSPSRTSARLWLLYWTGMRPSQLARLGSADIDLEAGVVMVPAGKDGDAIPMPLTLEGVQAARAFVASDGWGTFSSGSMNRALRDACAALKVPRFSVYALRRSFGSTMREAGADLADVQRLMGHRRPQTTALYAPIVGEKLRAAVQSLRVRDTLVGPPPLGD